MLDGVGTAHSILSNLAYSQKKQIEQLSEFFKNHPGTINDVDSEEKTLLHKATIAGLGDVAKWLISQQAKLDITDKFGRIALHYAASNGHSELTQILVCANPELTGLTDSNGQTALHFAVTSGYADCAIILIKFGSASILAKDNEGRSPLSLAEDFKKGAWQHKYFKSFISFEFRVYPNISYGL